MSFFNEALEWQDRAQQAREVVARLTDPAARQAMLQAAKGYEYLARAAAQRAPLYGGNRRSGRRKGSPG